MNELLHLTNGETVVRLLFAVLAGGIIGYEREKKGRAAGFRTHILVAVGSCILALIQEEVTSQLIQMAASSKAASTILSADNTRITAQIVSGIGFLGAGTIVVSNGNVRGLTTAASIWAAAGIGIAFGMGFYAIAGTGLVIILITLMLIKRLFTFPTIRMIRVEYQTNQVPQLKVLKYLEENSFEVLKTNKSLEREENQTKYIFEYRVDLKGKDELLLMEELDALEDYNSIHLFNPSDEID